MGQSVSNAAGAAFRIYDKVVHEQVFTKNVLWNNILRNIATNQGATTKYLTVHYDRNTGFAAGSETLTLPSAGYQQYKQATISMKYHFYQVSLTDVALQASKRSKEFLVDLLESEYKGAKEDMQRQLSREGYSIGTGVICRVNDAAPDTTLTFDTPFAGKYPTDYFSIGNAVMFSSDIDAATSAAYTTISAITGNYDMTVADATGIADNDYVFLAHTVASGSPSVSNVNAEAMGLAGLIDDGTNITTLQGIDRSSYIWWQAFVDDNATQRSLTEALIHSTLLESRKKGDPKYALTHFDVFSALGQLLSANRRYVKSDLTLRGGFKGLEFDGISIVADYDCPYDEMYFIDPTSLSVEDMAPISFMNEDGSVLSRSSTSPAWNATLRYYVNLCVNAPNKNAALRDVIK